MIQSRLRRHPFGMAVLGAIALVSVGCSGHPRRATASPPTGFPLVVTTDRGTVRGVHTDSGRVVSFLGIPYAAPPVGALRWQAPLPARPWGGVRKAVRFGSLCPQPASGDGPRSTTEDCLYVNVQRPASGTVRQRLPVYVYVHGGGLTTGDGSYFNMEKIVRQTGVIGVTFNYRLGIFGFLALRGAQGQASGNEGFLDQQAALRWLRRNVAEFGGDPNRITLGGESAGGWSVCAHLVAPGSQGLFARAIIQSGSCQTARDDQADATGSAFAAAAGCEEPSPGGTLACLRALPAGRLLDAETDAGFTSLLVSGTPAIPTDPRSDIRSGAFRHVPVLIGGTRDEGRSFTGADIGWTENAYASWVRAMFGHDAALVLAHYPWPPDADALTPAYLAGAILTDAGLIGPAAPSVETGIGGCGTQALIGDLARHTRVYAYEWTPRTAPGIVPIAGYENGAGHASELAYLWPSFTENGVRIAGRFDRAARELANQTVAYWGAFIHGGTPRVPGEPSWPPNAPNAGKVLSLGAPGRPRVLSSGTIYREHQCSLWDLLAGD